MHEPAPLPFPPASPSAHSPAPCGKDTYLILVIHISKNGGLRQVASRASDAPDALTELAPSDVGETAINVLT